MIFAITLNIDAWALLFLGTFGLSATTWGIIAASTGAAGIGASLYGANAQAKAQSGADNANRAAAAEADRTAWQRYLLQRGLYAGPNVANGQIPAGAQSVNSRLPLWANAKFTTSAPTWRRKAQAAPPAIPPAQIQPGIQP